MPASLSSALLCALLGLGATVCTACAPAGVAGAPRGQAVLGQPLPAFALRDLQSGQPLSLSSLSPGGLVLDVWASWCEPCKEELPLLDDLAGRLASAGTAVVAVSIDEDAASAREFLAQRQNWKLHLAHDPQGLVPKALQPSKMPSTYVVDRSGVVRKILEGFDRSELAKLERELTEKP